MAKYSSVEQTVQITQPGLLDLEAQRALIRPASQEADESYGCCRLIRYIFLSYCCMLRGCSAIVECDDDDDEDDEDN
ncbi:hypothetical protein CAEBREN_10265 [Caenorhabditis brenneri]|uniref:Uncharacterized protein n=1 Tax=Caenorhabditis brenneri TaxID=135651 RepID=G0N1Y3_CAEBE|nr:hypothetical protein CAEBREN_10265 [Caenorhabditis brenneri]